MKWFPMVVGAALACNPTPAIDDLGLPTLDPVAAGFNPDSLRSLTAFLQAKAREHAFPGAVLLIGRSSGVVYLSTVGVYGDDDRRPVTARTIYDMASLTKVVGLTTASYLLMNEGAIALDDPVSHYLPDFSGGERDRVTIRHLLTHTSGLPPWIPLWRETPDRHAAFQRIDEEPLENPPGTHYTYSDLGAILMGRVVERVVSQTLDQFLYYRVFRPLGMTDTRFNPPDSLKPRIAPTEFDAVYRGRLIRGEVHDENAYHLGGVSGHAGLFSTAPDLARFAMWLLSAWRGTLDSTANPFLPADFVRTVTARQPGPEGSTRAIGWDTPDPEGGSSAGHFLSPRSFGHTGFTGTSIWMDPERDLYIILLTNRVHPTRENRALLAIRGQVADRVVQALKDPSLDHRDP